MNINQIYDKLNIMPSIREHQKTVASIALKICDSLSRNVDTHSIISTCLLHDLGNILKGNGNFAPKAEEEKWEKIKEDTKQKYGGKADLATVNMIQSLALINEKKILEYLDWIGAKNLETKTIDDLKNLEYVIAPYSDLRTSPNGVVTVERRLEEARKRYNFIDDKSDEILQSARRMEITIFQYSWMTPQDITEETIKPYRKKIEEYVI